jgi:CubicO group peptidase (beta-lactamase class C family)
MATSRMNNHSDFSSEGLASISSSTGLGRLDSSRRGARSASDHVRDVGAGLRTYVVMTMSRRAARPAIVIGLAAILGCVPFAFAAPDEELLGKSKGYPSGTRANWHTDDSVRVGSYTNLDKLFPNQHHVLQRADEPSSLPKVAAAPPLRYRFGGRVYSIDDYLAHQRTTGLLVIKDGRILVERYQYDRKPTDRLTSNSMAKSLIGIGIGFALSEGRIRSLDDPVLTYVPELKGNLYGQTRIRSLLRMASGGRFREDNADRNDDAAAFARLHGNKGSVAAIRAFDTREAPEGERFHYASIETQVLTLVLRAAAGKSVAEYLTGRLWRPMGAEADATWITGPDDVERGAGFFNSTLRDWGRLAKLLANDGVLDGTQIIPKDYLVEATDWHRHPAAFAPKESPPTNGYGYQFWTMRGEKRRFVLRGVYGQAIYVDPELKLVLVHTAVAKTASISNEPMGAELGALWFGLVNTFGRW